MNELQMAIDLWMVGEISLYQTFAKISLSNLIVKWEILLQSQSNENKSILQVINFTGPEAEAIRKLLHHRRLIHIHIILPSSFFNF